MAAPHPGATQHCLPSLFPQPLAGLPPQFLLHCSLGKFFTQISCWNIWGFFIFPFPQTCSCSSCSHVPGEQVASFPSGAVPLCEAMAVSVPVPHQGHPTSSTLTLTMAPVTLLLCPPCFGVPVPISGCPIAPSPFVPNTVPWAAGGCGCPQPCTCLFYKPLSLLSACCVLLPEQWECGPSSVGGQEPGRGTLPFSGVPSQFMGAQSTCCSPHASLSSQHPLPASVSCCREHQEHPGWLLLIPVGRWGCSSCWNTAAGRDSTPRTRHHPPRTALFEMSPGSLGGTRMFIVPALGKGTCGDRAGGQPAWGWAGGGSAGAGGGTGTQDRDSGALPWAGTWVQ